MGTGFSLSLSLSLSLLSNGAAVADVVYTSSSGTLGYTTLTYELIQKPRTSTKNIGGDRKADRKYAPPPQMTIGGDYSHVHEDEECNNETHVSRILS